MGKESGGRGFSTCTLLYKNDGDQMFIQPVLLLCGVLQY